MCEMVWLAVVSTTKMQEHGGNDKSCVWHATDFVDGELKEEMFAIRFRYVESEFIFPFFCKYITTILCCFSSVLPSLMCCKILSDSICRPRGEYDLFVSFHFLKKIDSSVFV